jgi:hypothetical protein
MTTNTKELTVAQRKLAEQMPPELLKVAQQVATLIQAAQKATLLMFYDVGAELRAVADDPSTYGEAGMEEIGKYLGFTDESEVRKLYHWRDVAVEWDRPTLEREFAIRTASGQQLTLQHFILLTKVPEPKRRQKLLDDVRKKNWSANDLKLEIQGAKKAGKSTRGTVGNRPGMPPKLPESPAAAFQKGVSVAQKLANYLELLPEALFEPLNEIDDADLTPAILEKIQQFEEGLTTAKNEILANLELLVPVKERVENVLSGEGGEPEPAGEEEAPAPKGKTKKSAPKGKAKKKAVKA